MAFANYGELKAAVANYVNYGDTSVVNAIPMFISFAHDELNRVLRTPAQEQIIFHDVIDPTLRSLPIPINYLELKRAYYADDYTTIDLIDIELMQQMQQTGGRPDKMARNGDFWVLNNTANVGDRLYFTYYADVKVPAADSDTNVFIEQCSQALLYRSIAEAMRFLENMDLAEFWFARAEEQVVLLQNHADTAENSGSVIVQANFMWG